MALRPALMLEELREHLEDLPKPLPWHSRIALAVGYVTLAVGLGAIVTAVAMLFLLVTGGVALIFG